MTNQSFHNSIDATVRPYQAYTIAGTWRPTTTVVSRTRSVSYQFFPFFHPYVGRDRAFVPGIMLSLIQRLRDGGTPELEASDTLYMPQPNPPASAQPLTVQPGSTRATLASNLVATRPEDGSTVALTAGTPLTLPDGTSVTVPAGTAIAYTNGTTGSLAADLTFPLPGGDPLLGVGRDPGRGRHHHRAGLDAHHVAGQRHPGGTHR